MKRNQILAALTALLLLLLLPFSVFAESGSLTLSFPVDAIEFSLYSIGKVSNGIQLDDTFASMYPDGLPDDPELLADAALRLAAVAEASPLVPQTALVQSGKVTFSNLPTGLYLITAPEFTDEKTGAEYYIIPMLISLPARDTEGDPDWDISIAAKYTGTLEISAIKVWKNDKPENRPKAILVQLMKDGKADGIPILLTKEKNWRYTWKNLDPTSKYTVAELTKLSSYTTTIEQQGNVFQIINTRKPTPPSHLPQTGQLWWPVYVMGLGGMTFLLLGLLKKRREQ